MRVPASVVTPGGTDVKLGQFSTPIGYEVIDPTGNFFYSKSYIFNFGIHYNMFIGDNFSYQTVNPNTTIRFEMDVATGRGRALDVSSTPARSASWGDLKQLYR